MYRAQMVQINDVNCREKEVTVFLWRGRLLFCLLDILRSPQPSQPIKPALRQSEAEDNAEDDRASHLDRLHAVDGTLRGIVHNKLRMEAMARENTVSASVATTFGTGAPRSKSRSIRYTTQPIAPASPQKISSDLGAPKRSANESVAIKQTMICTIMLKYTS